MISSYLVAIKVLILHQYILDTISISIFTKLYMNVSMITLLYFKCHIQSIRSYHAVYDLSASIVSQ